MISGRYFCANLIYCFVLTKEKFFIIMLKKGTPYRIRKEMHMRTEQNYDFRKDYSTPHKRIYGHKERIPEKNEIKFGDSVKIFSAADGLVIKTAVKDFIAYFKTTFGITAALCEAAKDADIRITLSPEKVSGYMARKIAVTDNGVDITAADERGVAQALYMLEERMNLRKAPILAKDEGEYRPMFTPRMIHSGYGMDVFPDGYLSVCAHYGYDTVLSYVRSKDDKKELADLVKRAAKYGLDVYAYCAFQNFVHPLDEGAKEIYDDLYGGLFRDCPGLKGIVFVGESVEFPSRDPNVDPRPHTVRPKGGIPTGKPTPGWWPCYDYVEWISLIRDTIRAVEPEADIVLWTYNWGAKPKEARLALIENLPTDISLQATFEMFEAFDIGGCMSIVSDYSIWFSGPGKYFISEAEVAKKRGIRLYTQANTAGRTWDFGVVPYEPFPERWHDRNTALIDCQKKYGLAGLMESHHYGFNPSFISKLANGTFTEGTKDYETRLTEYAKAFSYEEYELVLDALRDLDESHKHNIPSSENQYGPYRIGPAYPFCLKRELKKPNTPAMAYGNGIYNVLPVRSDDRHKAPYSLRVRAELKHHREALALTKRALTKLKKIKVKSAELKKFINMVEFIMRCHITAVNFKEFYILTTKLYASANHEDIANIAARINKLCLREIENAKAAIPLVRRDSSLGYEPSMDYQCDEESILWKLRQMDFMMKNELAGYTDYKNNVNS